MEIKMIGNQLRTNWALSAKKPVKRNENLVVFSHEHHHGLVFCTRLGKAQNAKEKTLRDFVQDFWESHLSGHFEKEEELLLPWLTDKNLSDRLINDHREIKRLTESICHDGTPVKDALHLANFMTAHIRFEERIMFPWLENSLTDEKLIEIGYELDKTEIESHSFQPEFWKNKPVK